MFKKKKKALVVSLSTDLVHFWSKFQQFGSNWQGCYKKRFWKLNDLV